METMDESRTASDFVGFVDGVVARSLDGACPTKDELLRMLAVAPESEEADYLRRTGRETARVVADNKAHVWSALGVDRCLCPMNCRFCSFGEKWGLIKENFVWSEQDILTTAETFIKAGSRWFILRTTEFFDLERLCALGRKIRKQVPGTYSLVVNTGELTSKDALRLHDAGITGVYHVLRLGEGADTEFDPARRLATIAAVSNSPLELYHLVEPVGPEHTDADIADRMILARNHGAAVCGIMARINVQGTPFEGTEPISEARLSQLTAVSRICAGFVNPDVCVSPPRLSALKAGANVMVTEIGAVPRSNRIEHDAVFNGFGIADAKALFLEAGYDVD